MHVADAGEIVMNSSRSADSLVSPLNPKRPMTELAQTPSHRVIVRLAIF